MAVWTSLSYKLFRPEWFAIGEHLHRRTDVAHLAMIGKFIFYSSRAIRPDFFATNPDYRTTFCETFLDRNLAILFYESVRKYQWVAAITPSPR